MTSGSIALPILEEVRRQYEAHPYPDYHLLLPVRRQEAYASTGVFAAQLLREQGQLPALHRESLPRVLIAGCGDTFPLLLARWEPRAHRIDAIDLSVKNIVRARVRLGLGLVTRPVHFFQGALEDSELLNEPVYSHIDAYGVLHHTPNPASLLARLAASMLPGATLRLMVYNSPARLWIHHLQRGLKLLGIDPYRSRDLQLTRQLLALMEKNLPAFRDMLAPQRTLMSHDSRLVDTFLHAREARLDFTYWWQALDKAGLTPYGLFDRYAELDDLPSPLHHMPSLAQLIERAQDGRFENNLEIFCFKAEEKDQRAKAAGSPRAARPLPWGLYRCGPPAFWSSFTETAHLGFGRKLQVWSAFRSALVRDEAPPLDAQLKNLALPSLQRLVRIGALWPSSIRDAKRREQMLFKIHQEMEAPLRDSSSDLMTISELRQLIEGILREKGRSPHLATQVLRRLAAAAR